LLGVFALLAHAGADYALRTPALITVAAMLVAILIAQGERKRLVFDDGLASEAR
jgi:hypothetical protein